MTFIEGFGIVESVLFVVVGVLKFMWFYNRGENRTLSERLDKLENKFVSNEAKLFDNDSDMRASIAYIKGKLDSNES